ncbi:MAG TPA: carboxypeptidase regulatory-like domain-containing protein [Terriglobales bacterium]|jgi:tetratricopeptide (TPR) repeat protein|nr:carboxypeptidase regulatory-like domain-containing protein [Terriglobales bacterium]
MKRSLMVLLLAVVTAGVMQLPVFAQDFAQVKGVCKDRDGKPLTGAVVEWLNLENGRKYDVKTNKDGKYFSLGLDPGNYKITLLKDGKELFHEDKHNLTRDESTGNVDFNLQQEQQNADKGIGLTPEQEKQRQEALAEQQKEVTTVKSLNERLTAANQSMKAGDYDTAVTTLTEATQMDGTKDVLWASLGDAYAGSGLKQTDPAEKSKRLEQGIQDYSKAIALKKKAMEAGAKPADNVQLAGVYNNMARAEANDGKVDQAIADYNQAAQLNPANAGQYYFNLGATLTNANHTNDAKLRGAAIEAFDKSIAADPTRADAYYYKGTNLVGGATLQGDKMVAPEGTAEAFNKYLELQPTGPHAEDAKAMLASVGATVETTFGKKKSTGKK